MPLRVRAPRDPSAATGESDELLMKGMLPGSWHNAVHPTSEVRGGLFLLLGARHYSVASPAVVNHYFEQDE